jgi:hypothetical protein
VPARPRRIPPALHVLRTLSTPLAALHTALLATLLTVGLAPSRGFAQEFVPLEADRDAFTPSVFSVAPGRVLTEISHAYIDNLVGPPTNNYPELLVRIGATERFEWRFGANYGVGSQGTVVTSVEVGEGRLDGGTLYESNVLYGFKLALAEQVDRVLDACFIMEGTTPTSGDIFGTVPVATVVVGRELTARFPWRGAEPWRLDAAVRYAYSQSATEWFSRWTPSVVLRLPVTDRVELHAEWFGSYTDGLAEPTSQPFFSPGFHYQVGRNVEIGWRGGWALNATTAPFFSDAGLAYRW